MSPLHIAPIPAIPDFIVVVDLARPIKEEDEKTAESDNWGKRIPNI